MITSNTGMVNRKQYIISNKKLSIDGFIEKRLPDCWIYYDEDLNIRYIEDAQGCEWTLLGEVYSVKNADSTPEEEIKGSHTCDIEETYFYWTGRWTLIGNHELHIDATGMMSQYYYDSDEGWFISPSIALIYQLCHDDFPDFRQYMTPNASINWHPAPLTKLKGVQRMFSSQKLELSEGISVEYRDVISEKYRYISDDEKKTLLTTYLQNAVKNVSKYSGKMIWLASTAGYDSRMILAALLSTNTQFCTYTFLHDNIAKADTKIPAALSKKFCYKYQLIKRESKPDVHRMKEYDDHTFYCIDDADRVFYACGQYSKIPDNAITIKSVFEICRGFYYARIPNATDFRKKIEEQYPEILTYKNYKESIGMWFDWVDSNPNSMDIRDRFYMEQRIGGWLSNLQQSLDMLQSSQIQIANNAAILSASYWYSQDDKIKNRICYEQIGSMCPELLDYPFNPGEKCYILQVYLKNGFRHPIISGKKLLSRVARKLKKD